MITLQGQTRSTNSIYRYNKNRMYMTKAGKDLKEDFMWQIKTQWHNPPLKDRLKVKIEFYFGDKRKRDLDNQLKILLDSLEGIVFENDSQIDDIHLIRNHAKPPRIEIEIEPCG